jgi:hypothetical protein
MTEGMRGSKDEKVSTGKEKETKNVRKINSTMILKTENNKGKYRFEKREEERK